MIKKVRYLELKDLEEYFEFEPTNPIIGLVMHNHWFIKSFNEKSIYFGYWIEINNSAYKLISDIEISEEIKEIEVVNNREVNIITDSSRIKIYLDEEGLNITSINPIFISIFLDCRKLYSNADEGNIYRVIPDSNKYYINFKQEFEKYELNFFIYYEGNLRFINDLKQIEFDYDLKRNSAFYRFKILKGFEGYITKLKIFSENKNKILPIVSNTENPFKKFILDRILSLYNPDNGFKAGLPWFPQRWFRDELWTLLFLEKNSLEDLSLKENILEFYLNNLEKIYEKNKENDYIQAADTFLLIVNNLDDIKLIENAVKLKEILSNWEQTFNLNNLPAKSTWMDTLNRKRAIEIDFLFYSALKKLKLENKALEFKTILKSHIFTKSYPKEELYSPNLFLAYFISKDFFEEFEWFNFFDIIIEKYYLNWGGFSTKEKDSENFYKKHTGEDPSSYHSGDSWFWINNIGAYVLYNLSYRKYEKYIEKIKEASIINILKMGVLGYSSELSSAENLKYEGSLIQLWSLSSFYLLI